VLSSSIAVFFFFFAIFVARTMFLKLPSLNYLVPFVINGIKDTSSKKYIEELVLGWLKIKAYLKLDLKFLENSFL
jgi:hypothetical protein